MLFVLFVANEETYAVEAKLVIKVIPAVRLRHIPGSPDYVAGLFRYKGEVVPVLDLSRLLGEPGSTECLGTRILLVRYRGHAQSERILGLMAEKVIQTVRRDEADFDQTGVVSTIAPFLGKIACDPERMIQRIMIDRLFPQGLEAVLFPEE